MPRMADHPVTASARPRAPHGLQRVLGRDPHEPHRVATPLELLYDLTFAVAFGQAGGAFAHLYADGVIWPAVGAYLIAVFAIVLGWTNFSWFASAFDTDDWLHRLLTMVQMVGVVVLALGLPEFFGSVTSERAEPRQIITGYVVMRVAMVAQWLRVARDDPAHRAVALRFATAVAALQVLWVGLAFLHATWPVYVGGLVVLGIAELAVPFVLERRFGTPWHPHHIAERYSLMVIITLGEGVIGTVAALSAAIEAHGGWSAEAVLVVVAGIVLTFGLWWSYFTFDIGAALHAKGRTIVPGLVGFHLLILGALAGTGAGLHVADYVLARQAHIGTPVALAAVAVPVFAFFFGVYGFYTHVVPEADIRHILLMLATLALLAAAVGLAFVGASPGTCLAVLMLATLPTVLGYETFGYAHQREQLARLGQSAGADEGPR